MVHKGVAIPSGFGWSNINFFARFGIDLAHLREHFLGGTFCC
jgi:hypothetical protein